MKKILFVAATLGGGGAERVMLNLANAAEEMGNKIVVLRTATDKNPNAQYSVNEGIKIEEIICPYRNKIGRIVYKLCAIRKNIKKYNDYTIISFLPDVNIYSILASWRIKNKVIISERNDPNREPAGKFMRMVRNVVYRWADIIVFQTKDAQRYFSKRIQDKSCIIPNPLKIDELPLWNINGDKRNVIVMVCRVKPQKNVGMLIDAIEYIKEKLDDTTVEIYGDGNLYRDAMIKKVNDFNLDGIIKFMGPTKDVYSIMRDAKIYISTSDYEGISNTMLEALAIGTPCIVTDCPIGGARMFIEHNKNGILVPVGDYKRLGEEIVKLLKDVKLQNMFSTNSVSIRKELDLNLIIKKWVDIA